MRGTTDRRSERAASRSRPSTDGAVRLGAVAVAVAVLAALALAGSAAATPASAVAGPSASEEEVPLDGEWWNEHEWWRTDGDCSEDAVPPRGEVRVPVLLAQYAEDDEEDLVDPEAVEALLFGDDPAVASGPGSVADYYAAASGGQLRLDAGPEGVAGWYELDVERSAVDGAARETARAAIEAADDDGFDFAAYDDDGDGCVPVAVLTSGTSYGGEGVGKQPTLSAGGDPVRVDGVEIDSYTIQPARRDDHVREIGLFAHEFGHLLGLPDLYTDGGIDRWGLMGYGYRGSTDGPSSLGESPLEPTAWTRERVGWTEATSLPHRNEPGILPSAANHSAPYRLDLPGTADHVLLEARRPDGFDAGMALWNRNEPGLLVWHVDSGASDGVERGDRLDVTHLDGVGETHADGPDRAAPLAGGDSGLELADVTEAHGTYQFNDPPHRSLADGREAAYAVPVGVGLAPSEAPETRVDARVSWAAPENDVALELYAPDGTLVDAANGSDDTFAAVGSERHPATGAWTLVERASGDASYFAASSYPTYPLPTALDVEAAAIADGSDGDEVRIDVRVRSGDEPYSPGFFGTVRASQVDVELDGQPVADDAVSLERTDVGRYAITVEPDEAVATGTSVGVSFVDGKLGASRTVGPVDAVVGADGSGASASGPIRNRGAEAADDWLDETAIWHSDATVAPGEPVALAARGPVPAGSTATWTFEDGATHSGPVVTRSFDEPGDYDVELVVTGPDGSTGTDEATITVAEPPTPPVARVDADHETVAVGEPVTFDGSDSSHPDGEVAGYYWNLGGETVERGPEVVHAFDEPGTHRVALYVEDDRGVGDAAERTVEVREDAERPFAAVEATPTEVNVGEPVTVDASESRSPVEDDVVCDVSFDDGTTTTTADCAATHVYDEPGTYEVSVTAADGDSRTDVASEVVTVVDDLEPPEAVLETGHAELAVGEQLVVTSTESTFPNGSLERSEFDFGDGTTRERRYFAAHTYDEPGTYEVELTVVDDDGLVGTDAVEVTVVRPSEE